MLQEDAMIVRFSISQWTARKFDKKASDKIASDFNVSSEVGRYNKLLISKQALESITRAVSAVKVFHYTNTLPWDDAGGRLLPSTNFFEYSKKMRGFRDDFERAVREFVSNYDDYRDAAQKNLGAMFSNSDYPSKGEIKRKFGFSVDIEPVPYAPDFRISLGTKDMDRIKRELEKREQDRLSAATKDLFIRLNDVVNKLFEALSEDGKIFRNSKIDNIIDIVNILPRLNVANDPDLEALRKETKAKLCGLEPDILRNNSIARSTAAANAEEIMKKMGAYFGKK
jgi:hypothetical protein